MKHLFEFLRKYRTFFLLPLWVGFLAFPFVSAERVFETPALSPGEHAFWGVLAHGGARSLCISLATFGVLVLWKLTRSEAVAGGFRIAVGQLQVAKPVAGRISLFLKSPGALMVLLLFFIVVPLFQNNYYRDIMTLTGMYIVLALGLNIVVGQTGLLNLGYAAFYAIGAYTYAILSTSYGLTFWPGLVA
jgi:hypothetical protein